MKIGVIGGGRWGRVLVSVLCEMTHGQEIVWFTRFNFDKAHKFLHERGLAKVSLLSDEPEFWRSGVASIINSSSTKDHYSINFRALSLGLPVFSEKPFALTLPEADHLIALAAEKNCVVGVDLEIMYASYLGDLKSRISEARLESLEISWKDPKSEMRHGELKQTGDETPLTHDALPHCWSVAHFLYPEKYIALESAAQDIKGDVLISGRIGAAPLSVVISRRAPVRERRIQINGGAFTLDFSEEPGWITASGKSEQLEWHGLRPLVGALTDFLRAI